MINFLIVMDTIVAIGLIAVILLQRSEGGVLGMGGSKMGGVFTSRGIGDALTKATTILGIALFSITILLSILVSQQYNQKSGLEVDEREIKAAEAQKINEREMQLEQDLRNIMKEVDSKTAQ
ncbi:MAG: preprotein translocase subunit SecG [Rickettsiales bacterium]|nr:preprotein translocase subunit SecG [Rickettsiales bacterium]